MNPAPAYFQPAPAEPQRLTVDLCVYGCASGAIISAIEAAERGLTVALVAPARHLGGMTSGGLGMTDIGNKSAIGGKAREFYQRVGLHYGAPVEWRFEPSVAARVLDDWLTATTVRVCRAQYLDTVIKEDGLLRAIRTVSGLEVTARMFIDATYEGDLLARAGVSHRIGREANREFGETLNGQHICGGHQFLQPVDPYITPGAPGSGLLPGIEPVNDYQHGGGDHRVQAYNFRLCLTRRADLRLPFPKPAAYDAAWYELLKRHLATGWREVFDKFDPIRNGKTDTNNHGAVSTDFIGQNHAYPAAAYAQRERIFQAHVTWQQGLLWCLANDPAIPAAVREPMRAWGLCRDEFTDTGGWPHTLYVREARRLLGETIMTEHHCTGAVTAARAIGLASYGMDSHHCRRLVVAGRVQNEGDIQASLQRPYPIPYEALLPRRAECRNLLVTCCLSATHIAFGSIRMEPVFMVLGQSAAVAVALALEEKIALHDVNYDTLKAELQRQRQVLDPAQTEPQTGVHAELAAP
ncbi:MAG: FAD-dependent oxidoreductase [Verrucomicrobiales bacterium]|jgi:hypothetical protein|nr:FAD-dependent oxidoreductase [Verrucomicrobiales bacterium]